MFFFETLSPATPHLICAKKLAIIRCSTYPLDGVNGLFLVLFSRLTVEVMLALRDIPQQLGRITWDNLKECGL